MGQPTDATFVYYDDTGAWGATIESLRSITPELLLVVRDDVPADGQVLLAGLQPGLGSVEVQLYGWEGERHEFAIQVIDEEGAYDEPTPHPRPGTPLPPVDGGVVDDGGVVTCHGTLAPL